MEEFFYPFDTHLRLLNERLDLSDSQIYWQVEKEIGADKDKCKQKCIPYLEYDSDGIQYEACMEECRENEAWEEEQKKSDRRTNGKKAKSRKRSY